MSDFNRYMSGGGLYMLSGTGTILAGATTRCSAHAMESLLSDPNPKLQTIFDCAEVLFRHLQNEDERACRLMAKPQVIAGLISFALDEEQQNPMTGYALVATELLCTDVPTVITYLLTNSTPLHKLFQSPLINENVVDCWCKITKSLLHRIPAVMFELFTQFDMTECLLTKLHTLSMMETVWKFVSLDNRETPVIQYLINCDFFARHIELLEKTDEQRVSVCHFIAGVLNISEQSTLTILRHLLSSKWLVKCLEAIHSRGAILPNGILISAVDILVEIFAQLFDSKQRCNVVDLSVLRIAFADALPSISSVLLDYSKLYGLAEQAHGIVPKLGMERLKLYRLLSCIPLICDEELAQVFRACSLPKRFTEAFWTFVSNNLLHSSFVDFCSNVFENELLINDLIQGARLLQRICESQRHTEALSEKPRCFKPAYIGHLTLVAETVITWQKSKDQQQLPDNFNDLNWTDYANKAFPEIKRRDNFFLGSIETMERLVQPVEDNDDVVAINGIYPCGADERVSTFFSRYLALTILFAHHGQYTQ